MKFVFSDIAITGFLWFYIDVMTVTINGRPPCQCYENSGLLKTDAMMNKSDVHEQDIIETPKKKRCCPYNFDGKICRIVGDRLLCGYNRNVGSQHKDEEVVNLNNGCRIKKGRLECGYWEPPYANTRRPPMWDHHDEKEGNKEKYGEKLISSEENHITKMLVTKTRGSYVTRCVEIKERIVCRHI